MKRSQIKSSFQSLERTFKSIERSFKSSERSFNSLEQRFLCGLTKFSTRLRSFSLTAASTFQPDYFPFSYRTIRIFKRMRVYHVARGIICQIVNYSKITAVGLNYSRQRPSIPAKDGKNKLLMNQNYEIR